MPALTVEGIPEVQAALKAMLAKARQANRNTVREVGQTLEKATKRTLTTSSHPRGTPTPSMPGEPPSLVSGNLRRSVLTRGPYSTGDGYSVTVGPTAIYSRIHELGGETGRGVQLPARPYLGPAWESVLPLIPEIAARNWVAIFGA